MFDLPVKSVMNRKKFLTAAAHTTVAKAAQLMAQKNVGAVVVVAGEQLLGIFSERDVVFRVVAAGLDAQTTPLSEVMTPSPHTIESTRPFGCALYMMHEYGFRHVPVVENGKPVGIVSARKALDPDLEEFVSEAERRRQYASIAA